MIDQTTTIQHRTPVSCPTQALDAHQTQNLAFLYDELGENTLRAYSRAWDDLARFMGLSGRLDALAQMVRLSAGEANLLAARYRKHMADLGMAARTISSRLGAISGIIKRARRFGLCAFRLDIEPIKLTRSKDTAGPGVANVEKIIAAIDTTTPLGARNRAIVELLFNPALRRSEVIEVDLAHLDLDAAKLSIWGKARSEREWIPLPDSATDSLREWIRYRGQEPGPLFVRMDRGRKSNIERLDDQSVRLIVRRYALPLEIDARPHGLRHSGITEVARVTGGDIVATMAFARHSSPATTKAYLDNLHNAAKRATQAVDRARRGEGESNVGFVEGKKI